MNKIKGFIKENRFTTLMSLFLLLFMLLQNINHRFWMHDFEVYYTASNNFFHNQQVYFQSYGLGSGFYKYSPIALFFFLPLSVLHFTVAKIIYFVIISFCIVYVIILLKDIIYKYYGASNKTNALLFLSVLVLSNNFYRELHLGNVNLILLLLNVISLSFLIQSKNVKAGILIGITILIKPFMLILLPLLLFRNKLKSLSVSVITFVAGLILPAIYCGFNVNNQLLQDWYKSMMMHNSNLLEYSNTVYTIIYKLVSPVIIFNADKTYMLIVLALVASGFLIFLIRNINNEKSNKINTLHEVRQRHFIIEFFILIALVPNISSTDTEHFLFALPLIMLLIYAMQNQLTGTVILNSVIITGFVLYGGNWGDLVGRKASVWMINNGIAGIGNMIIIISSIYLCIVIATKLKQSYPNNPPLT